MLHIQKYLENHTLDDLDIEFSIKVVYHDSFPLLVLNYSQIDSPKTHSITRECRGLVLNAETFEVVAYPIRRFFNWGEIQQEMNLFDFSDFVIQEKVDGSFINLFYFNNKWMVTTRGSFCQNKLQFGNLTWEEGICRALKVDNLQEIKGLSTDTNYIMEFCSPWNKVVRQYVEPQCFLLTAFRDGQELSADFFVDNPNIIKLSKYYFNTIDNIKIFLKEKEEFDPTFEGVVIRDCENRRWKIKSATYLSLHKMAYNMFHPKYLLPFVLAGESDELLCYFPEVKGEYFKLKTKVDEWYETLKELWNNYKNLESQKEFALAIQGKTPYTSVLFNLRKSGGELKDEWRQSEKNILKNLG